MRVFNLVFYFICFQFSYSVSFLNDLRMINDVITSYEQPTAIIAKLCYISVHKIQLTRMLTTENKMMRFLREAELLTINKPGNHLMFVVDTNCQDYKHYLDQANDLKLYSKVYRWLIIGKISILMEELAVSNILVDSEFVIAEKQTPTLFTLQAIYKIRPYSEWIIEHYGTWTTSGGLNKSKDREISNAMRRKNLRGTTITASMIAEDNRTKTTYAELGSGTKDTISTSSYSTLKYIFDFYNATSLVKFTDTWGYLVNGTWTGMTKDIHKGEAELCGTVMFMNEKRLAVVEYIRAPNTFTVSYIVFRQPPLSYENNLFILPFTNGVWYSLGGFTVILVIIFYFSAKWDIKQYEEKNKKIADPTCLRGTWSDIIIFILSAISQQGSYNELKGNRGRLVMFIMILSFVFLYTAYSASIIVLLQSTSDKIRTISDLTNSKLEIGMENASYIRYYFSEAYARDPVRKAFYETKIAPKPTFLSLEDGVKRLQKKPFAFNMNVGAGYKIISELFQEHEKCGLQEIDYIRSGKAMFCSKRYSPFSEMFRIGINRFEEHGFSDRNNRYSFLKKPSCTVVGSNFKSVNMIDFYPVLLLLLYGIILAFILLILEIWFQRRQRII